jgi:MerR family gold-responsive transcriptional activator of gol and ges genes
MMNRPFTIGRLSQATGVPAKTIRYYEQVGTLPVPGRSEAGYRQYTQRDVHRLLFIRRARALGLSLKALKALTAELDNGSCGTMRPHMLDMACTQLDTVQRQITELQLLQQQLEQIVRRLQTSPPSDHAKSCQCLDVDAAPQQEGSQQTCISMLGGNTMDIQQTLETVTILPTTSCCDDGHCDCGCGCDVAQLSVPAATVQPCTCGEVSEAVTP